MQVKTSKTWTSYPITKETFNCEKIYENLDATKPITEQEGVFITYTEGNEIKKAYPGHGLLCIFQSVDGKNYILGSPRANPAADKPIELQASIGGRVTEGVSIKDSLQKAIDYKTHGKFPSLNAFSFSPIYFCHRKHEWDMCYLTLTATSTKKYTLDELKEMAKSINAVSETKAENKERFFYEIYELSEVIPAAQKTNGLPEGSGKPSTPLKNHLNGETKNHVIFDDTATSGLASSLRDILEPPQVEKTHQNT